MGLFGLFGPAWEGARKRDLPLAFARTSIATVLSCTLGAVALGWSGDASASTCIDVTRDGATLPWRVPSEVPINGALVLHAGATGDVRGHLLDFLDVVVTDDSGRIDGQLATVLLEENNYSQQLALVWVPDEGFEPGATYGVDLELDPSLDTGFSGPFEPATFTTTAQPAMPSIASLGPLETRVAESQSGPVVCCDEYADECGNPRPACGSSELRDVGVVSASVLGTDDADEVSEGLVYYRNVTGTNGTADQVGRWLSSSTQAAVGAFPELASSLCVGVETVSILDGSVLGHDFECAAVDGYDPQDLRTNDLSWLESICESPMYWQDTGEPYVPSDDDDDSDGGEPSGDDDSPSEPDGDTDGAPGGADDGLEVRDSSCACDVNREAPPALSGFALFGLLAARRRRR